MSDMGNLVPKKLRTDETPGPSHEYHAQQGTNILMLPLDILAEILTMFPMKDVTGIFRLVCKRFQQASLLVLKHELMSAGPRIDRAMKEVEKLMHVVVGEYHLPVAMRIYNRLELIKAQYLLLRAVTWRCNSSSYGGCLLDELQTLIRGAKHGIHYIYDSLGLTSRQQVEFDLRTSKFMTYFEKNFQYGDNAAPYTYACKLVDLLDCIHGGPEFRIFDKNERTSFKALYILPRCWFTCIKWGKNETIEWQEEQRNMFLRVRRLVQCYNNHHLQDQHSEREDLIYFPDNRPSPVGVSYTGIGEYPGYLFFYGSLNKSAFNSRIQNGNFESTSMDNETAEERTVDNVSVTPGLAQPLCLKIFVDIDCINCLAPLTCQGDSKDIIGIADDYKFRLKVIFQCEGSQVNRLPHTICYEVLPTSSSIVLLDNLPPNYESVFTQGNAKLL